MEFIWLIKPLSLIIGLTLLTLIANAQAKLSGKVIDSATLKPLAGASVYIGNSTIGTKTDDNGMYSFADLSQGNCQLLVSYVGYQTRQAEINVGQGNNNLNIQLKSKAIELTEVTIHSTNDWAKNLNLFKREFIGTNNARECEILNPDVLNLVFDAKNNRLNASTDDFLDIENSVLGYKLRFLIKEFWADYRTRKVHYTGTVIFEELHGKKSVENRWIKKRAETYKGSFRHFLTALVANQTDKEKFEIRKLTRTINLQRPADSVIKAKTKMFSQQVHDLSGNPATDSLLKWFRFDRAPKIIDKLEKKQLHADDIVHATPQQGIYDLIFSDYLYVIYKGKKTHYDGDDLNRFDEAGSYQTAAISKKKAIQPVVFNSKGLLITKDDVFYEGAWNSRIINMLPDDYVPTVK